MESYVGKNILCHNRMYEVFRDWLSVPLTFHRIIWSKTSLFSSASGCAVADHDQLELNSWKDLNTSLTETWVSFQIPRVSPITKFLIFVSHNRKRRTEKFNRALTFIAIRFPQHD